MFYSPTEDIIPPNVQDPVQHYSDRQRTSFRKPVSAFHWLGCKTREREPLLLMS